MRTEVRRRKVERTSPTPRRGPGSRILRPPTSDLPPSSLLPSSVLAGAGRLSRMYTLRFTRRLLANVSGGVDDDAAQAPTTALGDWYVAPVLAKRRPLLLCTSERSLLSVMLPAEDMDELPEHLAVALVGVLHRLDVPRTAVAREIDAMTSGDTGAAHNRSTLGSMRGLAARAQAFLAGSSGEVDVAALYTHLGEYRSRAAGPDTAAARAVALLTARPGDAGRAASTERRRG